MTKKYVPLGEAAEVIGEAPSLVRRLLDEGVLKGRRRTTTAPIEILESSLDDYLDEESDDDADDRDEFDRGYDEGFADAAAETDE